MTQTDKRQFPDYPALNRIIEIETRNTNEIEKSRDYFRTLRVILALSRGGDQEGEKEFFESIDSILEYLEKELKNKNKDLFLSMASEGKIVDSEDESEVEVVENVYMEGSQYDPEDIPNTSTGWETKWMGDFEKVNTVNGLNGKPYPGELD